jgi:WD40 repeat protein
MPRSAPDGSEVVIADDDGKVRVYDLATSKAVMTLDAGEASAWSVAFSPHGKRIVAGYSSGRARVWDVSTRLQLTLVAGSASGVTGAQFNADGSEVVTASDDGTVRVWHSQPRELRTEFASSSSGGTPNPVGGARYISSSRILTLDGSGRLSVFTASGEQQAVINPGTAVGSVAWNRAGTEIVTADSDGTVDLWHAIGSNTPRSPSPHPST